MHALINSFVSFHFQIISFANLIALVYFFINLTCNLVYAVPFIFFKFCFPFSITFDFKKKIITIACSLIYANISQKWANLCWLFDMVPSQKNFLWVSKNDGSSIQKLIWEFSSFTSAVEKLIKKKGKRREKKQLFMKTLWLIK